MLLVLPFGLSLEPYIFKKLIRCVLIHLRYLEVWVTAKNYVANWQSFQSLTKEKDKVRVKYDFSDDLLYKHFYESNSELDSRYRIVNVKSSLRVNISFWQEICVNKNVVNIIRER